MAELSSNINNYLKSSNHTNQKTEIMRVDKKTTQQYAVYQIQWHRLVESKRVEKIYHAIINFKK